MPLVWASLDAAAQTCAALGANMMRLMLHIGGDVGGAYDVNVPKDAFEASIGRAARAVPQVGKVRQRDYKAYFVRDMECEVPVPGAHDPHAHAAEPLAADAAAAAQLRVQRMCLVGSGELAGTPLVVLAYRRDRLPVNAFPCGARLHDVRCTRQLHMAACSHPAASIVFESHVQSRGSTTAQPGSSVIRKVFVDVQLDPPGAASSACTGLQDEVYGIVLGRTGAARQA